MKKFIITYRDPKSGSHDQEAVLLKGGMKAAKEYARQNANGWIVEQVIGA